MITFSPGQAGTFAVVFPSGFPEDVDPAVLESILAEAAERKGARPVSGWERRESRFGSEIAYVCKAEETA